MSTNARVVGSQTLLKEVQAKIAFVATISAIRQGLFRQSALSANISSLLLAQWQEHGILFICEDVD